MLQHQHLPEPEQVKILVGHEAYRMGYDAYWNGVGPKECPLLSYHARKEWMTGWNMARKETHR